MHPTYDGVHLHTCLRSPSHIPDTTDSFTQCVSNAHTRLSILGLAGGNTGAVEKRPFIRARNKLAFILLFPSQPLRCPTGCRNFYLELKSPKTARAAS